MQFKGAAVVYIDEAALLETHRHAGWRLEPFVGAETLHVPLVSGDALDGAAAAERPVAGANPVASERPTALREGAEQAAIALRGMDDPAVATVWFSGGGRGECRQTNTRPTCQQGSLGTIGTPW